MLVKKKLDNGDVRFTTLDAGVPINTTLKLNATVPGKATVEFGDRSKKTGKDGKPRCPRRAASAESSSITKRAASAPSSSITKRAASAPSSSISRWRTRVTKPQRAP